MKVLNFVIDDYYLVNLVNNDYVHDNMILFKLIEQSYQLSVNHNTRSSTEKSGTICERLNGTHCVSSDEENNATTLIKLSK